MKKKLLLCIMTCAIMLGGCGISESLQQGMQDAMNDSSSQTTETSSNEETASSEAESSESIAPETQVPETQVPETQTVETETSASEVESILGYTVYKEKVMNGTNTESIGQRDYIEINKSDLQNMSQEQYAELCTYVGTLSDNWFTVKCEDGTGLVFNGCSSIIVTYGEIDDLGRIEKAIGNIMKKDGLYEYTKSE